MNRKRGLFVFLCYHIIILTGFSQASYLGEEISSPFNRAMELYNKEKYPSAIKFFDLFLVESAGESETRLADAEYYAALSALKLFNTDAEYRMLKYISSHPESQKLNDAWLALGDYSFQNRNYRKASTYYDAVNRLELPSENLPEYYFRNGYSQFMRGEKKKALLMFSEIKDIDTDYTPPAVYYFSHIAYEDKMYETALEGFMRLKDDETFGGVVPFYIVQILYLKKDYDQILTIAPELLKSAGTQRAVELYRFIGDAYYNNGNYREAISYLEKYSTGARASAREDKYQLAYCYYKTGEYDKAIEIFLNLTARSDVISQNIWCLLGDCYLQKGDKKRAHFAFGQASLLDYDRDIKEEALFNYAKLSYETSYSPFGEAILAFQEYIDLYPGSDRISEVYDYLVATYMQLKNYKAALESLDKIRIKDARLEEAYQRVAFYRGLELFRNMNMEPAIDMFDKSLKYEKYNRAIRAQAIYWRGEARYRLGDYDNALADYQTFMGIPGSMLLPEYKMVRYNIGYSLFNKKDYSGALSNFKSFETNSSRDVIPAIQADAMNRIADCYYMIPNYPLAIEYYDKVIDYALIDADYALYQKGFALGLINDYKSKVNVLTALITRFANSKYVPGALFERGRAHVVLKNTDQGEADFNTVINNFQSSPFVPRAIVQLGLLYFNTGENQKAIAQFKKAIENYKSTPEARSALTGLRNTYVEMNDVEEYFTYVKTLNGFGDVNMAEKDSLLYGSGENLYMAGDCDKATEIFKNYLDEFTNGSFSLNARFYLAECALSKGNRDEALKYYEAVIGTGTSVFTGPALSTAAAIMFEKEDYVKSLDYYEKLEKISVSPEVVIEALRGQLRSAYQAGDAEKTIAVARKIDDSQGIPEELVIEATFMAAKAYYSLNRYDEALRDFRKTSGEVTSVEGAESKYRVAEILNMKGQTADAEKVVNEFISQNTPHQYWMAKMFILLADISVKKGDMIMARATLQSLKDNYPVDSDGILDEVSEKLESMGSGGDIGADTLKTVQTASRMTNK